MNTNDVIICNCKKISKSTILKAIENGARSMSEIKKATGAGTGICGGAACTFKIYALIDEYVSKKKNSNTNLML